MERTNVAGKALLALTALGGGLVVAAVVFFALAGSGFGADVLRSTVGFVLGMAAVAALTRSPQRGTLVAAVVLLVAVAGFLAPLFVWPDRMLLFAEHRPGWARFVSGFVASVAGASLMRLVGFNPLGPRGAQVSRRRL